MSSSQSTAAADLHRASEPRVLFLAPPVEDYLAITLLHGLREVLGAKVVDYPRYDVAYDSFPDAKRRSVYGRGFSVFFALRDIEIARANVEARLRAGEFDLVVFADIWRQFELFARWRPMLSEASTVIVDGADSPSVYPHAGFWWRRPSSWLLPRADRGFLYFKREWTQDSQFNLWHRFIPRSARRRLVPYVGLRPISFSFIEAKIRKDSPKKTKDFGRHVVDPEVAARVPGSATSYAFESEEEYYADLSSSRFGITTKRSGWDCLRHYEIAANGAVPCFRDLEQKPVNCAPHGLVPGENCLAYRNAAELLQLIRSTDEPGYRRLQIGAREWVLRHTTRCLATELLASWETWRLRRTGP